MMQTKLSILFGLLVGITSFSSSLFAQTSCFGYDTNANAPAGFHLEVETFATFDGSESSPALADLAGSTTYRIFLHTNSALDFVSAVHTDGASGEVQLTSSTSFYMNDFGGITVNAINPGLFSFFPEMEYDSYVTIGLDSEAESSAGESSIALTGSETWGSSFLAGNNLSIDGTNSVAGSGWSVDEGAANGYAGDDTKVMLAQVTTDGELNGTMFVEILANGAGAPESFQFSFSSELCGCTDASASNYEATATQDDGSCLFPGCTDSTACNYDAIANDDDGSCEFCCDTVESTNDAYGVEVELHAVGGITGMRTYRLYVTTANATDAVSAVTGYSAYPMSLATTTDFYQYLGPGGGVTPNGWQSAFGVIPEFAAGAYDSFVTIGNTEMADAGAGESDVQTVSTPGENWEAEFEAGNDITIETSSGGGWFLSPGSVSGIAGDDNRVLIGQFTTNGFLSGDLYVQVFPEGNQLASEEIYISFTSPACACTDETACNFDPAALWDDGSCQDGPAYWGENIDCEGNCLNDADGDYVCDENEIEGCLNPNACNYVGAPTDLVTCIFPEEGLDCDGNCLSDVDGDGICDQDELGGCTDATACNYDETATEENGTCTYPVSSAYDCDNVCFNDEDGDGTCDEFEVSGCTDESACNYDASNTEEDGSCDYCCASGASVVGYNIIIEDMGDTPEGKRQRMYIETPNTTDVLSAVTGDVINPTFIRSTLPFFQSPLGDVTPNGINPAFFPIFEELAYDSWVTIGIEDNMLSPTESSVQIVPPTTDWQSTFNAGGDIELEGDFGDGWFVIWDETAGTYTNGLSGDDNRILVGQFTTNGILSGELFVQMFPEGDQQNPIQVHLPFGYSSEDADAPVFTSVPADVTQNCGAAWPTDMATAIDEGCIAETTVTVEETLTDTDCGYLLTRMFTATDAWGNSATATQLVSLVDNEAPVAVAQADLTVECSDDLTPGAGVAEFPTNSYDSCSDELSFSYVDAPYSPGFDLTGVTADFHVEMGKDFGGPFGQSLILEATGVAIGSGAEITYDDLTSNPSSHRGAIAVDIEGSAIYMSVVGTDGFPYQYDYAIVTVSNMSIDDLAGVSVVANGIAPGAEVSTSSSGNGFTVTWTGTATYTEDDAAEFAADNVSSCLAESGLMRTWTVTDGCDNSDTAVQYFTIVDTEGPVFTSTPANLQLSCNDEIPMSTVSAEDCGSVSISDPVEETQEGTCGTSYTVFRTWTASDDCGNSSEFTQTIMIVDNEAPVFTSFPADVTYTYGEDMMSDEPTASDDCNEVTIEFSDSQDNSNAETTVITRTWTATDACGNSVSQDQIISVNEVFGCMDDSACNYNSGASYDDGSCDYCSCGSGGEAGFGLELELVTNHDGSNPDLPVGLSTYRVYVTTPTADDFVSSISGSSDVPAYLNTTTSFFQHPFGAISPDNINTLFFAVVPSLMYDSWLTIGLDSQPSGEESAITFVEAPGDNWMAEFNAGNNLNIDSFFGGSWFALITANNGYAGDDQRVLVAQLTTDGELNGQLYVQVFPNGDQSQDTYLTLSFGGNECGCNDEMACNYDASVTYDDGSCFYPVDGGECEVLGCMTSLACNYNADANTDDGSCEFVSCAGCMDEAACNYDMDATVPGFCEFPAFAWEDCDGGCADGFDTNGNGICDPLDFGGCTDMESLNYSPFATYDDGSCIASVSGCTNVNACNYDSTATLNDSGSCIYPESIFVDCDGNCSNDTDGDGVCDEFEIPGCTDATAVNFNAFATDDNGTCFYTDVVGCLVPSLPCYDPDATVMPSISLCFDCTGGTGDSPTPLGVITECADEAACNFGAEGECEYSSCMGCTVPTACNYDEEAVYFDGSCEYTSCAGCTLASACNFDPEASINDGSCDFSSCTGCTDENASNYDPTATVDNGSCDYAGCMIAAACNYDASATSSDGSCEFESCAGCLSELACNYDDTATLPGACDFTSCVGCTNPAADNYDADATQDDGSCIVTGCIDPLACNYDDAVNNADYDSCTYAEEGLDCDGVCLNDVDPANGVCDEDEIWGCMEEGNCLYDPEATANDPTMCQTSPFCIGCNDATACNFNPNVNPEPNFNDGSCEYETCAGCLDEAACNFDLEATLSDASACEYPAEGFDCAGNCFDDNGDLICDILQGCAEPDACNYEEGIEFPLLELCDFCSCPNVETSLEGYGIEVEETVSGIDGAMTYQVFVTTPTSTDVVNAILGNELNPIVLASSSEIYQDMAGSALPSPASMFAFFPMLEYDSFVTLGEETPADAMEFPPTSDGSDPAWVTSFENGGNIEITDAVGSGWYMNANVMGQYGVAGDDNRVMVAQLTTPGSIHGQLYVQIFPEGLSAGNTVYVNLSFGSAACGCTDPMACNYEADNATDDGSCFYAAEGENCGATCLYDYSDPEVIAFEETYTTSCEDADTDVREPVFADNCDDLLDVTMSDVLFEGDCNGSYTIERTWMAVDNVGNSTSAVQTINVVDETAPSFTVPADLSVSCTAAGLDPAETGDVSDAEDCSGTAEVTFEDVYSTDGCFANNVVTRTWTAVDDCGNATSQEQIITLVDDNAPYFTNVPAAVALTCGDELPTENATAADACSDVTVTFSDADGDMTCSGLSEVIRTFTAMDACGNSSTAVQVITFVDDEAPTGAVTDATVSCSEYDSSAEFGSYETSDNCSGDVTVTWIELGGAEPSTLEYDEDESGDLSSDASNPTVLGTLPLGTTTIAGSMANFQSVNSDPEYFTIEVAEGQVISSIVLAEFTHNGFPTEGGGGFIGIGEGTSLPVLSSMEDFPAATAALFGGALVGVMPGTAPGDEILDDLEAPFEFMGLEIAGFDGGVSNGTYTMMFKEGLETAGPDAYTDYTLIITVEEEQAGCFEVVREYTFTDACGNSSTAMQTITVFDLDAPVMDDLPGMYESSWTNENGLEVHAEVTLACGEELPAAPGATDACSAVEVTFEDTFGGYGCTGEEHFFRTYTATDACGNAVSATLLVSYVDDIAPTFTAPADVTLECDSDLSDLALTGDVMDAADVCSADIYVAYTDASSTSEGSCLADNVVIRTWTVTDGCGNSASADQIITLEDTTAPVVTYDANVILENVATSELDDFEGVEVMDACSDWTYTSMDTWLGNSLTGYELNRVMVITDACGNSTTIEQSITAVYATGCTYMDAENYDAAAIVDDGSCEYAGCTDMASANYNPIASIDDGSCVTVGCMDPDGYDYDPNANYPGGCDYPDPCPGDINDDGFVNVGDLLEFFQYYGQICDE